MSEEILPNTASGFCEPLEEKAEKLPTYSEARGRVHAGGASELDKFVFVYEPKDREGAGEFRVALSALLAAAEVRGAEREREECAKVADGFTGCRSPIGALHAVGWNDAAARIANAIRIRSRPADPGDAE